MEYEAAKLVAAAEGVSVSTLLRGLVVPEVRRRLQDQLDAMTGGEMSQVDEPAEETS